MSDGDNAAAGHRSPGQPDDADPRTDKPANDWLTRTPRPTPAAAPWERRGVPSASSAPSVSSGGSHTDGVTVAALIAKVSGTAPDEKRDEPRRRRENTA